ncbi:MAG: hypothetical protein AABO58_13525 [Acidobacteriota bacterium]
MKILCVAVGFSAYCGGASQRNYQMARHLLDAGEDVRLLITDRWLVDGETAPGYPFPAERLTVLPLINRRYNVPLLLPCGRRRWGEISGFPAGGASISLAIGFSPGGDSNLRER